MSIKLMTWAWETEIPATEKMVLLCLCDHANDDGQCWPSMARIARKCSVTDRTVQRAIKNLRELGILHTEGEPGKTLKFHITPRHSVTPDTASPPTMTTRPPTHSRRTPDTVSPKPLENLHQEPSLVKSPPSDDTPLTIEEVVEDWNEMAAELGLPTVHKITTARRRAFKARLRDYPELADWSRAFDCIRKAPWMHGNNDRDWCADFDFLLQAKSFTKLTEEAYGQTKRRVA